MSDAQSCLAFFSQSASILAVLYTWTGARDGHRQNRLQHMLSPLVKWDDTAKRFTVGQEDRLIGKGNVWVVTKVCRVLSYSPPEYLTAAMALGPSATLWLRARPAVAGRLGRVAGCCFLMDIPMVSRLWLRPLITRWTGGRQGNRQTQIYTYRHAHGRVVWEAPQIEWEVVTDWHQNHTDPNS